MYRDNTLVPTEAVRLLALGLLATRSRCYGDLAAEVRHFTGRLVGPSLDLVGAPLEVLKVEGLIAPRDPPSDSNHHGADDKTPLVITAAGRSELLRLLSSNFRAPVNEFNKLIIALKLRFLHVLPSDEQSLQAEMLVEISERELARLSDLQTQEATENNHFTLWLDHEIAQVRERLAWYQGLKDRLTAQAP
ncbi:MAG: hypothetical protein AAF530_20950 [Pseudomonadota bacterium]